MKKYRCLILLLAGVFAFTVFVLSGCAHTAEIAFTGNQSVGDRWLSVISPEGIVREESSRYIQKQSRQKYPIVGGPGTFSFTYKAVSPGEAEIVLSNHFRGGPPTKSITYIAVVDSRKRLTVTLKENE